MAENTENTQPTSPVINMDEALKSINSAPTYQSNSGVLFPNSSVPTYSSNNIAELTTSKFTPMPLSQAYRDIGGNALTGPNNNVTGSSIADYLNNGSFAYDPKFAGVTDIYGASNAGLRFAKAYNHSAFDRLGFSPYVNNTDRYLGYATGWEDFKTAIAPNRLFTAGMVDQATNWFEWNKPTDPAAARLMTNTMSLYQTERTGFWGGAANTMASLQYSMGAITEFALEEGALIGLTAATGGAAGEGGFLRTIRNIGALGRSLSVGAELLNTIRTVDRAKDFWQAAKFAGVGAAKTANALINPLYRTTSNVYDTYKGVKAGKTTAEIAKNKAYFGDFFRDLSEINMSLSEARLEGGMAQNDIYDGILKSNPNLTSDQAKTAYELAVKGGSETTMWNAMAIYMTNKFVFDSLLGRMMPKSSRLLKMGESLGGKYVMDQGKHVFLEDGFGKNLRRAILPFSKEGKLYYKHFLQTAPTRMSTFALGSSMEGLQENVQEALNIAYTDYYTKLYNTPELAQSQGLRASISKGIHEQFTTQGLQTFLSGFAIGGGLGAYGKALNWSLYKAPMIVADKTGISKEYSTAKEARAKFRDEVNSVVADMDADPISYFNAIENDLAHQVNFYDYVFAAQNAGDNKQVKTNQDAQLLKRIHTLFRSGQVDLLRDTFKEYRNMSDQDLQEAFQGYKLEGDENNKPLRDRLDETLNKIDVMENAFKEAQKIENPYNPFKFDKTKEPDKYNEEAYKYLAVEEVKFDMAFLKTTLVLAQQYTADILEKAAKNKPLANMPGVQFTSIITKNGLKTEIDMLRKERIAYEQTAATSDKAKAELGRIDKKLDLYEKFLSGYELYQDAKRNAPADIIRNKSQKKQDGETEQTINPVTESIENHADNLKNAFFDVIKELASETGDNPLSENIDDLFESLREMIDHDVDFSSSIDALNMLYDPAGFEAHHGRIKQALENVHKMHKENNTKIFDELQHRKDLNAFLNNLMAKGIFYDPKYAAAFEDDSVLPESFIDATTMEELDHTSPKYKDLLNEIDNFERSTGKTLSGKLIPEFDPLSISTRVQRAPADVRTMAVLSRQFGVSQDTTEDSVSVEEVLEALMKSPQALPTEKVLAKRLLPLVSKAAKINFVRNLSQPVSYSESTGIMVDLRYASIDYSGGILKAEPIVLSGILKSIVTNALETNNNFKQKAQNLLNIAKQNILDKNNNYSQLPIGLDSVENFIAEALTNINFQASLRNIEYTGERASKTSLWQEFKKALEDLFTKIFKLAPKTKQTLLDEAIDLTALTIDANANMVGSSPATGGSTPSNNPAGVPVTQGMPFEEIMAIPQYAESLRKVFAAFPQLGTDEDAFKQFVLTNPSAKGVIDNLNVQTGRTNPNAQVPGESQSGSSNNNVAPGQEVISDDDLRLFRENNTVSDDILNDIKTRREQGQDLTPRQQEIMKSSYGEIIEKAISLQIDQIDQDKQTEIQIMAEAEKLTMPDIYGPMEEYPFGADKAFNLIYGGKLHIVKDEKGNYTAILFQNLTQEQVLAGEGIKTFAVSTILQRPEPGYKPLQDLLRPLQAKIDEIVAKNTKPVATDEFGFSALGNIGNTGLAIIENDINKLGKYVTTGISKATPEQRQRLDSNIEELKKKYPEKNITSRVEGDTLIVEASSAPTTTDTQAKIDALEKRRQEELESENYRIITSSKLFSDNEGNFYKVNKLANGKTQVLIADENGRTLGEIGTFDGSLSLDTILNGTESQYGTRANTNNKLELTEVKDLKFTNKIVDKINARYNAEIDALIDEEIMTALAAVQDEEAFTGARELTPEEELQQEKIIADIRAKYAAKPAPTTPAAPTVSTDAKADIERRKKISYSLEPGSQSSYERNKFTFTYVRPFDYNELDNIRPVGQNAYIVNNYGEQKTFDSYAEGQKWLDSKYNAELATPTTTTKTEPEKTEEQQVDDDINTNPETRDEVNEGMSGVDNATTEVENDIAEIERKANEGKTAPLTERAKETINQIKEATAKLKESMKSSYAKMGPEMTNAYEKLRRAHKQTAGKVREKLKVLLDKILKFLRKLGDIVKTSFNKVFSKRTTEGFVIQPGAPTVTVTGLETKDNTLEQVSDFISNLLNNYGFTAFFKQSGFAITPDLIKSLDTKGSKLGDSQILGYASAMETALHKLLHLYIDTKVSGKEMSRFDAKAKVRIETIKTLIGQKIAEGKPYQSTLDKLNYILDKNPAHQIAAYFMTNREFRSLVSGLSKDSYRALEILSKDMTGFTDAKVRKFITLQDGLNMADEEYDSFEKNSVPSPMTILSEAIENTGGEGTVANLANQLATPIEEIIATETTEEELQEIAKSEGKSVTEIVTDIKNAVTRYLSSTTLGRTKTSLDQAPKTKKESVIRRIIRKLRNILMAMSISFGMYTGVAGFDMSTSSTAEEDVAKPAWSVANAIDNTMYWLPISESYKQTIMRGFIKYGIYDISNVKEAVIEDVAEAQAIKESEDRLEYIRQNTYFQDFGKEGTVRDDRGGSTDSLFMYRNQWFNDVGFEYLATPSNSTRDRVGQMTYNNTVAVAHFYIMDDTGGDLSRYTSAEKLQEARDVFKKRIGTYDVKLTDYVPVFKFMPRNEQGENIVKLQYKIASELTNDDIAITKLLQWKFSDIDWDSKVGLYDASYCLTTKSGAKAPSFTFSRNPKGRDSYSRFSGSTIVFIFNDQKGNTIVREFTGPLNAIKAEAESIMQTFNVEPEDLTLGAFDAGSYSGKPKAKSNVLDTNQWDGFNKIHPNAGSALVIPISSTTKMIQLSDISAPQSEINNVINEKTKACK